MDRWHKGPACCPVSRDKGGDTGKWGRGGEEEGRSGGGMARSSWCWILSLSVCNPSTHEAHTPQTKHNKINSTLCWTVSIIFLGLDFISAISPWSPFIKDYINSFDHKHLMRQQGVWVNPIIHLIYKRKRKNNSCNMPIFQARMHAFKKQIYWDRAHTQNHIA